MRGAEHESSVRKKELENDELWRNKSAWEPGPWVMAAEGIQTWAKGIELIFEMDPGGWDGSRLGLISCFPLHRWGQATFTVSLLPGQQLGAHWPANGAFQKGTQHCSVPIEWVISIKGPLLWNSIQAQFPSASRRLFFFRSQALLCGYRTGLSLGPIAFSKTQQMLLINKHIDHTDMGCQGLNSWMKWALRVPSGSWLHLKGQQLLESSWSILWKGEVRIIFSALCLPCCNKVKTSVHRCYLTY